MSAGVIGIGLIGVGGYGRIHRQSIALAQARGLCRLEAAVILPGLESAVEAELRSQGVRIYRGHREMLERERPGVGDVTLVGIPCGIADHAPLSLDALEAGCHVLCEKPAAGCRSEAERMREAARRTGRVLAIGYQNLHSPTIQRIKTLAVEGRSGRGLGGLLQARTATVWPRDAGYYARNTWAGRLVVNGVTVNDSPVQNAAAHELQNLLYVAGPSAEESATPVLLYGEQYRAKDIESADTQYLRVTTREGPVLTFMATHACRSSFGPVETYVFEHGTIRWDGSARGHTVVSYGDGRTETLDNGVDDVHALSYLGTLEALRRGRSPAATIENTIQHCYCVDALFRTCPIHPVRSTVDGDRRVIDGIEDLMLRMAESGRSFQEAGAPWARAGAEVRI